MLQFRLIWFWYALASAILSAISVTFNKRVLNTKVHAPLLSWAIFAISIPIAFTFSVITSFPNLTNLFFFAILASATTFSLSKTLQLSAFESSELSYVFPLYSIAPLTLYILGVVFLSEKIKFTALLGILFTVIGVYILNFKREEKNFLHPLTSLFKNKVSRIVLASIILANLTAIAEKTAIKNTFPQTPLFVTFSENLLITFFLSGYLTHKDKYWFKEVKNNRLNLLIAGLIYFLLAASVIFGFKEGPVALVSAIKKLEILFVLIISYIFFDERPPKTVYIGAFFMLVAVVLIRL